MPVAGNYFIQTSVDKQVNLVNADGLTLNYWDGDAGPKNNGVIDGGSGTWRVGGAGTSDNWTNTAGTVNAAWSQGAFAVFAGQGGNVKVDSATAIQVQGMQFAANGYTLVNNAGTDALTLTGAVVSGGGPNEADVRVGDGSAGGAGYGQHRRHAGGRGQAGQDGPGHLGAVRRQYLCRRHRCQKRHAAGSAEPQPWRGFGRAIAGRRHAGRDREFQHGARHHAGRGQRRHQRDGRSHRSWRDQRHRRQRRIDQAGRRLADAASG